MDRKSVNIGIRSVLNSSPDPLTINELWTDYIKLCGSQVPVRDLGFRNLHDYLRSIPDVVSLDDPNSPHSLVRAVNDKKSQHIAKFVQEQKVSKSTKVRPKRRFLHRRSTTQEFVPLDFQRRVLDMLTNYSDGLHIDDFREFVNFIQQDMQLQISFDSVLRRISSYVVMNNDEINLTKRYLDQYRQESGQSFPRRPNEKIIVDDSNTEDEDYDEFLSSNPSDTDYSCTSPIRPADEARMLRSSRDPNDPALNRNLVSDTLVKNFFVLLDENPRGFWLTDLASKYESKFGYRLDPLQHGFDCVMDMVIQLKDVFNMIKFEKSGDNFLRDARKIPQDTGSSEQGELPKSVVQEIKKILLNRSNHQLYTDELVTEYRECFRKTLDPTDFGFKNINGLLKSLSDNESSLFSFKQVRQRTVMYLKSTHNEDQSFVQEIDSDGALPCNYDFNFLPAEVCNYDFKLPNNAILERLMPGDKIQVKMAEVYGPEKFYLHFDDDVDNLNMMMEDLHIFYENNSNTYELSHDTVRRGMLCACPFHQDSKWHRVNVVMCRGTSDVKVRYLDYGTLREVSVNKLRYLHSDFARLPALCVRAKLSGIKTRKFDESEKEQQKDFYRLVGETFFELSNNAKELEAEIVSIDMMNQFIEVHLYAKTEDENFFSIGERLIEGELVIRKEIDDVVKLPVPKQTSTANVAPSMPSISANAENFSKISEKISLSSNVQPKSKKNRPPPGIPIPPNLTMTTSSASTSTSTQTTNQGKTTFSGYTQSKMNPLNPPFYPPGYNPSPMPPPQPPMYNQHPQSMPMGPPMPPQFMYPTSQPPRPHPLMYPSMPAYTAYSVPQPPPPPMYEYYVQSSMRPPMPPSYTYMAPQNVPKPPPGFNYGCKPAQKSAPIPNAAYATGIPLYSCCDTTGTGLYQCAGSSFNHTAFNSYCCCGLDCSLKEVPPTSQARTPSQEQDSKPEWISKLEVVRDLLLQKDMPSESLTDKLNEIIGDISAIPKEDEPKIELPKKSAAVIAKAVPDVVPAHIKNIDTFVKESLPNSLNDLSVNDDRSSTPITTFSSAAARNGTVDLSDISQIKQNKSPSSESEFSVKSEGKESTRDEIKQAKIEQLRLFVMYQSKNLKKT